MQRPAGKRSASVGRQHHLGKDDVDLDPAGPVAWNVVPGGQSMDPMSPHFRDGADLWWRNRSHRVHIVERDVAAGAASRVRFTAP